MGDRSMTFIASVSLFCLLGVVFPQLSHDPIPFTLVTSEEPSATLVPTDSSLIIPISTSGLDLEATIYESSTPPTHNLYNLSNYSPSSACTYYQSSQKLNHLTKLNLAPKGIESSLIFAGYLYLITVDDPGDFANANAPRRLEVYRLNTDSLNITFNFSYSFSDNGLKLVHPPKIVEYEGFIFLTDGHLLLLYIPPSATNPSPSMATVTQLVDDSVVEDNVLLEFFTHSPHLIIATTSKIFFFERNNSSVSKVVDFITPKELYGMFIFGERLFILRESIMVSYSLDDIVLHKKFDPVQIINLESKACSFGEASDEIIHLICTEDRRRYVVELAVNFCPDLSHCPNTNWTFTVNRYFLELEDVKFTKSFGFNHELLILGGDQELILTSYGTNRDILLKLRPYEHRIRSFGMEQIYEMGQSLEQFSGIAIFEDSVSIFAVDKVQATVECFWENMTAHYLLIATNVTQCSNIPSIYALCTELNPINLTIPQFEMTIQGKLVVTLLSIMLGLTMVFLALGCCCQRRAQRLHLMRKIMAKIQALRSRQQEMRPL